jgi:hypothetical protein
MKIRVTLWIMMMCLFTIPIQAMAQTGIEFPSPPLMIVADGDLWAWHTDTQTLTRLVDLEYPIMGGLALSPDGTKLALSENVTGLFRATNVPIYEGTPPNNIWILDRATGETRQAAGQPDDLSSAFYRSRPVWSPDGAQLAWVESQGIVIYDVAGGYTRVFSDEVDYGFQDAGIVVPTVLWGSQLSISVTTFDVSPPGSVLYLYDAQGVRASYPIGTLDSYADSAAYIPYEGTLHRWVEYQGAWWVGVHFNRGEDYLLQPMTNEWVRLSEPPTLQRASWLENALQLRLNIHDQDYEWEILLPDGSLVPLEGINHYDFSLAISPDGQSLIYTTGQGNDKTLMLWQNGESHAFILNQEVEVEGLAWAPMLWHAAGEAVPVSAPTLSPTM